MKVRAIRTFVDKYSMEDVNKGSEIEISEERFSELTAGPHGIFVEEIKKDPPADPPKEQNANEAPKVFKCKQCDFETTNKGELGPHYKTTHPKPKE